MTSVGRPQSPIDMAVIGFIDEIDLPEEESKPPRKTRVSR